jgi:hypothetical protein
MTCVVALAEGVVEAAVTGAGALEATVVTVRLPRATSPTPTPAAMAPARRARNATPYMSVLLDVDGAGEGTTPAAGSGGGVTRE